MNTKIISTCRTILIVNFACTDDGDAMSVAPRSDSSSLAVRDRMDEGKHNNTYVELLKFGNATRLKNEQAIIY